MKKKGDWEYREDAEKALLSLVTRYPKTVSQLTREMREDFFSKIHFVTVQRLLGNLKRGGKVRWTDKGKRRLWHL